MHKTHIQTWLLIELSLLGFPSLSFPQWRSGVSEQEGGGHTQNQEMPPRSTKACTFFCSLCRMWARKERTWENKILNCCTYNNSMPRSSWYQAHLCKMLFLYGAIHAMLLILKIIPWSKTNGFISLILQWRALICSEVKWFTHAQVLVQKRQA